MKTRISYYIKGRAKVEGTSDYPYPSPSDSSDLNTEKNHKKDFIYFHPLYFRKDNLKVYNILPLLRNVKH